MFKMRAVLEFEKIQNGLGSLEAQNVGNSVAIEVSLKSLSCLVFIGCNKPRFLGLIKRPSCQKF